jgi:6-phosphogluconolactonase
MSEKSPAAYWVYIGSYTMDTGIHLFRFDTALGELTAQGLAAKIGRPNFQAISPNEKYLYSGAREQLAGDQKLDKLAAFSIDRTSGMLTLLNQEPTGGENPCFVTVDAAGKNALVSHYEAASVAVLPIDSTGRVAPPSSIMHQRGSSVHPKRQIHSFPHSINLDPASKFAFVPDLGADRLFIYRFDSMAGTLVPSNPPTITIPPGSGPRHFTFHPSAKFAYLINELTNSVIAYRYDAAAGMLHELQQISTHPPDYTGHGQAAEILAHPNGKFLYTSNRGHDSIAIFAIDPSSGRLTSIGHESTQGSWPRNFRIDPAGNWLLAANQRSDSVFLYRIDQSTGKLSRAGGPYAVPQPSCVKFLAVE